jgi:hypothetical protein
MNSDDWRLLFEVDGQNKPNIPNAVTYIRSWDSACRAVHLGCDDGNDYIVKGSQVGRSAYNDQVVGRIAWALGAPVASVSLVHVEPELISNNREMAHMNPGTAHGSLVVPDCTEGAWFQHVGLRHRELNDACGYLQKITTEIIARAITSVPAEWGRVDEAQRLALAQYLWERCETMRS